MKRLIFAFMLLATPGFAVQPDEILDDPVLEERARDLSQDLRCLVCRNESIDDSNAELARDLRILLRERLVAGDTDDQAMDFIVSRFGEYVLLRPRTGGSNMVLWAAGPVMFLLALGSALVYVRRRAATGQAAPGVALSDDEKERLKKIIDT